MKIFKLSIEGYRKHKKTEVYFSDATFLIGENNSGKSSVLKALELLLSVKAKAKDEDFYKNSVDEKQDKEIVITGWFNEIEDEVKKSKGIKNRIFYHEGYGDTFVYRKIYTLGDSNKARIEAREHPVEIKAEYRDCKTIEEMISLGADKTWFENIGISLTKNLNNTDRKKLLDIEELVNIDLENERWADNPGGFENIVQEKLPKFLMIPAMDKFGDNVSGNKNGALNELLNIFFDEIKEQSETYQLIKDNLKKLSGELDATNEDTEIYKLVNDLNTVASEVFSAANVNVKSNLSDANDVIKPTFNIDISTNVKTPVEYQGAGTIRSIVFALLRYRAKRDITMSGKQQSLIIGFEEPEIYLHPNAISKMRDVIYALASQGNNQIICTTHSPYMINLDYEHKQVVNHLSDSENCGNGCQVACTPINLTESFERLHDDNKKYLKMLIRLEDSLARCFFVKNVLVVEGDTEYVAINETLKFVSEETRSRILSDWFILRAHGKPIIISIVKYLKALGINPYVMHDKDTGINGAEKFNSYISKAVDDQIHLYVLEDCIEDVLGYKPGTEKPFRAYQYFSNITKPDDISADWRSVFESIFKDVSWE